MFNASIVLYKHSPAEISPLVKSIARSKLVKNIFLIDNSPEETPEFRTLPATYLFNNKNLGYGAGHNIALRASIKENIPFHLVLNPDIELQAEIFEKIEDFMNKNPQAGQVMPKIMFENGKIQYICKLIPRPSDLLFRRFLPKRWSEKRMEVFELRASGYKKVMNVPYLSGCFMFLRTDALKKVGLFDERFFMYPEDIDLTRRMHRDYETLFYPEVQVIHAHNQASYKSKKMLWIHIVNIVKYFNKWGWIFDEERERINKETLKQIK